MEYKWTDEKIQFLKNNYANSDWDTICQKLQYNDKQKIRVKAQYLGIKRDSRFIPKETIDFIINNYNFMNIKDLSKITGKSIDMIRHIVSKNNIAKLGHFWTDNEIEILKNNYDTKSVKELSVLLNRSESAIWTKASELNITNLCWSDEEKQILIDKYPHYSNKEISAKFLSNREYYSIRTMARKMGLKKSKEKGLKWFNPDTLLEQLKELADKLGRTPTTYELVENGLQSEITYRRYFGAYTKACVLANLEVNIPVYMQGHTKAFLSKNNDICLSSYEVIITNFLIDNNISYKKEQNYNKYINDKRCKYKVCDWIICNNIFVEFFGLQGLKSYDIRTKEKIQICKDNNVKLIEIYAKDLKQLTKIFQEYLNKNP